MLHRERRPLKSLIIIIVQLRINQEDIIVVQSRRREDWKSDGVMLDEGSTRMGWMKGEI